MQVNVGVAKTRKLLENDGVHALIGGVATPVIYATAPLIIKAQTPYIITVGGGAEITRKSKRNDYSFRTSYNIWAQTYPFAKWIAQNKTKKVYIFCPDYAAGKEFADAFKAGFTEGGGTIVGESYAPLATPDFVPFLTKVAEAKPEGIFGFWAASAAMRSSGSVLRTSIVSTGWARMPSGSVAAMPMRASPGSMPSAGWERGSVTGSSGEAGRRMVENIREAIKSGSTFM